MVIFGCKVQRRPVELVSLIYDLLIFVKFNIQCSSEDLCTFIVEMVRAFGPSLVLLEISLHLLVLCGFISDTES